MNIKIILSEYCHVLVILYATLAVLCPSSIKLSIKVLTDLKIDFFFFYSQKVLKIWLYNFLVCYRGNSCVCLRINLREIDETGLGPKRIDARDVQCHRYAPTTRRRYRGELLEIRFARYTAESCPVINCVVASDRRMRLPDDAMRETIIWYKRPTIWNATSSSRTYLSHFSLLLSLSLLVRTYALYICTYVLCNSRKTDYYPENDKRRRGGIYCNEQFCV